MLTAAWSVCAILPLGVFSAAAGAQGEEAQAEPILTLERWFNPEYDFLAYEKKYSREWIYDFVRRMSTAARDADPEVVQLRENAEFMALCKTIMDSNFSDIGSVRPSVIKLLSEYDVLCKRLLQFHPRHAGGRLCFYKFFTGKKPSLPSTDGEPRPEFLEFMEKIEDIPNEIRRLSCESLLADRKYNCPVSLMALLAVRSNWGRNQEEIDTFIAEMFAMCDSKELFEKVAELMVANLQHMKVLRDETRCKNVLGKLLELGIKFSTLANIKAFTWSYKDPVTRSCLAEALRDECSKYDETGLPDGAAPPAWCYKHRELLREYPDEIFAAVWRSYSREVEAFPAFAETVEFMFKRKRFNVPLIPDLPPQVGYLLLYFLKSDDYKYKFSVIDWQIIRYKFFAKLCDENLAAMLCLEALDENDSGVYLREQLNQLPTGRRESLSAWIENNPEGLANYPDLWNETLKAMLNLISRLLKEN
ncbi:hypothetical protein PAPHI01_1071 [Pancytospora philotis]|nr:hypothetical protein PAPHI01_1071 [Pancytospora philotis]